MVRTWNIKHGVFFSRIRWQFQSILLKRKYFEYRGKSLGYWGSHAWQGTLNTLSSSLLPGRLFDIQKVLMYQLSRMRISIFLLPSIQFLPDPFLLWLRLSAPECHKHHHFRQCESFSSVANSENVCRMAEFVYTNSQPFFERSRVVITLMRRRSFSK